MHYAAVFSSLALLLSGVAADYFPLSETSPEPRQPGWDRRCLQWAKAETGDTCWALTTYLNISLQEFYEINPQLHGDCVRNLWAGYWYCTAITVPADVGPSVTTLVTQYTATTFSTQTTTHGASFRPITEDELEARSTQFGKATGPPAKP